MKLSCPKCESTRTTKNRGCLFFALVLFFFPLSLLLFLTRPIRRCSECGYTWKA